MSLLCVEVANTIIDQLGGMALLRLMIGAREFSTIASTVKIRGGVRFRLPAFGRPRINLIQIELNNSDLYDVKFFFVRRVAGVPTPKEVATVNDVYADGLRECIERTTGFVLTAPRFV